MKTVEKTIEKSILNDYFLNKSKYDELLISKIPFAGNYLVNAFFPITYYTMDTASMFRSYAQASVLKVIEDITKESGIRISEIDKKPILNDVFKR